VNPRMETDEPGVYAIGDVVTVDGKPHPQLAHVGLGRGHRRRRSAWRARGRSP
jgi:thioredoxin reductase